MSFSIRLAQDITAVEAGATVPLSIEVTNKGEEVDRFEMQVEGIDPEWTASPEPVFTVGAHEVHSQKVFFKPPRVSESLAGNYPFVVKVRSLESGDSRTVQGVLEIKAFNHLSMEVSPKKGQSTPVRKQFSFTLMVMNLGNTEHTLQLSGADPDEECAFEFESEQVTVGPGQQREVAVGVSAANGSWISSGHLYGFAISARSIQNPNLTASTQAQLERRPLLSLGTLLTFVVLVAAFFLWLAVRPQDPSLSLFADSATVMRGQSVHVHWKALHANSVKLVVMRYAHGTNEPPESNDFPAEGETDILAQDEDQITVTAAAVGDNNRMSPPKELYIGVKPPPAVVPPKILSFTAERRFINLGEPITFDFDYSGDVVKLVLLPMNEQILPPAKTIQVTPSQAGKVEYELVVYNKDNASATAQVTVDAEPKSEANIVDFSANPPTVVAPDSKATVSWNVMNAASVQLDDGSSVGPQPVDGVGNRDIVVDKTVTLKLIATDTNGVSTSKKITIKFKPLPPTDNTLPPGVPPPGGGLGTGTRTGGPR